MVQVTPSPDHQDLLGKDHQIKAESRTLVTTDQVQVTGGLRVPEQDRHLLEVMVALQEVTTVRREAMDHRDITLLHISPLPGTTLPQATGQEDTNHHQSMVPQDTGPLVQAMSPGPLVPGTEVAPGTGPLASEEDTTLGAAQSGGTTVGLPRGPCPDLLSE